MGVSVVLARTCNNVCGHVAIITETESTYVMIESTCRFYDIEVIPGLLPLLRAVQRSRMRSRERSGRWPGNEAKALLRTQNAVFVINGLAASLAHFTQISNRWVMIRATNCCINRVFAKSDLREYNCLQQKINFCGIFWVIPQWVTYYW